MGEILLIFCVEFCGEIYTILQRVCMAVLDHYTFILIQHTKHTSISQQMKQAPAPGSWPWPWPRLLCCCAAVLCCCAVLCCAVLLCCAAVLCCAVLLCCAAVLCCAVLCCCVIPGLVLDPGLQPRPGVMRELFYPPPPYFESDGQTHCLWRQRIK